MTNRSRARWSLAVAVTAHAIALAWIVERARSEQGAARTSTTPIEVEIAAPEPEPSSAPPEPAAATPAPPAHAKSREPAAARSEAPAASTTATPAPVVSAEPGAASEGSWTFSPTTRPPPTAAEAAAAEQAARLSKATATAVAAVLEEANRKAEDRARKPLIFTARDLDVGLVPGGQYVSITRDRVRNSLVPVESHALLEFWTDSKGIVARVRILGTPADTRAWEEVASALAEDAHTAYPLKVPSNADGLIVTLDVTSVLKTLSGASASRSTLARVWSAVQDPVDTVLDSKAVPQRIVSARVVSVEAF